MIFPLRIVKSSVCVGLWMKYVVSLGNWVTIRSDDFRKKNRDLGSRSDDFPLRIVCIFLLFVIRVKLYIKDLVRLFERGDRLSQ